MKEVYQQRDAKGKVVPMRLSREMGVDPPQRHKGETESEYRRQIVKDMMALSKADDTWKAYARWWPTWEEWAEAYGIQPWEGGDNLVDIMAVMQHAVADMYAKGGLAVRTIEQMVQAVVTRLKDTGEGNLRAFPELASQMEGLARKLGKVTRKKDCTDEEDVAAFMDEEVPPWGGSCGEMRWINCVNIVLLGWAAFLRRQELVNLRLCDLTWLEDKLVVWVQNTKNDKQGEGRESEIHASEEAAGRGLMEEIRDSLLSLHGTLDRSEQCTKQTAPTKRCAHCKPVFPSVTSNAVHDYPIPKSSLPKLLKRGYEWLEERGRVTKGKHARISTSSLRRGGNTMAAAEGIRQTVRAKHGRWKSEATPTEYDGLAPGEERRVSRALDKRLHRARSKRTREACSTGRRKAQRQRCEV